MRIVIALGGNALLRRGQPMTSDNQVGSIRRAAERIARIAPGNDLVVAHGNGPQVGLLALQAAAWAEQSDGVPPYPLDVLGAESEAMIGYVIERELGNLVAADQRTATLLTMIEVEADDPAFDDPTKPIGPVYDEDTARRLADEHGWTVAPDGDHVRRVVPSPRPLRIVEIEPIRMLLDAGVLLVCAGGGGIPTVRDTEGRLHGVEAVIDKDLAAALLAREVGADLLVIATDVDGVYESFGTPDQRRVETLTVQQARDLELPPGSMGPKVAAASEFAEHGGRCVIGSLDDIEAMVAGTAGTRVG